MIALRKQRVQSTLPNHIILMILFLLAFLPVLSLLMNSFKSTAEIGSNPLGIPQTWRFENYTEAWEGGRYGTILRNSIIITSTTILGTLALAGPAAYALARLHLRGDG